METFLSMIGSLQLFDLVYIIWGQYVSTTAGVSTMATYMVREGRGAGNYGYGSAVALIIFVISLIVALTYQHFVLKRTDHRQEDPDAQRRGEQRQCDALLDLPEPCTVHLCRFVQFLRNRLHACKHEDDGESDVFPADEQQQRPDLFCCFVILPIILGAYYGFYQWKGFGTPSENGKFVGLQNYIVSIPCI